MQLSSSFKECTWATVWMMYLLTSLEDVVQALSYFLGKSSINESLVVLCVCRRDIHRLFFFFCRSRAAIHFSSHTSERDREIQKEHQSQAATAPQRLLSLQEPEFLPKGKVTTLKTL